MQNERDGAKAGLKAAEKAIEDGTDFLNKVRADAEQYSGDLRAASANLQSLRAQLPYTSEAEAQAECKARIAERDALKATLAAHETARKEAGARLTQAETMRKAQQAAVKTREAELQAVCAQTEAAIQSAGFADRAAVAAALLPCRDAHDREQWLKDEQAFLADYHTGLESHRERIRLLSDQTAGKTITDLDALGAEIAAVKTAADRENRLWDAAKLHFAHHRDILDTVQREKNALAATDGAWARLERLGRVAVGTTGEGGRLSFDRYVMGAVFREILDMANLRLDQMSGGRYELVHKITADRTNAQAGLDLEVFDRTTRTSRASASLSGGESFYTSLALALGLSDVVQSHAGGKKLDALFIDEGFGSLSDDKLASALEVLGALTEGDRLVGIISHVDKLSTSIPQQIQVQSGPNGSTLRVVI